MGAAAAVLSVGMARPLYGAFEGVEPKASVDGSVNVPFYPAAEVLICGGTLFACQLALESARSGKKTMLVMDRVNPFLEGISCLQGWVDAADVAIFPEVVRGVLSESTSEVREGRCYFNAFRAAMEIEDRLIEAGVRFLYNASVAGALAQEGELVGVVFGGKTGFFAIEGAVIVDATPEATVARAAGVSRVRQEGKRRFLYRVELSAPASVREIEYRATNGARVKANVHDAFAEFDVELDSAAAGPFAFSRDFERVYAAVLEMPWKGSEKRFRGADGFFWSGVDRVECPGGRVKEHPRLRVFGPAGVNGNQEGSLVLREWRSLFDAFPKALESLSEGARIAFVERSGVYSLWNRAVEEANREEMVSRFEDSGFSEPEVNHRKVLFRSPVVSESVELLVVGGGTSGNAASYAAGALGVSALCLERGYELGGTNTLGGVTNLWYGNKTRAFSDYYEAMDAKNDALNAPGFYRGVRRAGTSVLFGCAVTGVGVEGRQIRRVYVTTPDGLAAVEAKHLIDATGDGALAAWAGAPYTFGGEHDELTLWASFAGFFPGKPEALRPFLSPCDERSAVDATRFIVSMRRNSKLALDRKRAHPPFYLAARESRHIRGGKTVTFVDLLAGRRFRDGVFRAESNPDIKGLATSAAANAGLIPTNWRAVFRVTVPYAAMVPVNLDNVLVAGKAYSATHDALAAARMQRDLCVMGMVASHAVQLARESGVLLREIPVTRLQATLISKGMLKPEDVAEDDLGFGWSAAEMARKVAGASNPDKALSVSAMLCLIPRGEAVSALAAHMREANANVHRVGAFLGIAESLEWYASAVEKAFKEPSLSLELFGGEGTKHLMPDQGYAPEPALMLGSLVRARDRRAVPLLLKLAERSEFREEELRGAWGYLYVLACGFERLACPEARAVLRKVAGSSLFAGRVVRRDQDPRACKDSIGERFAYLQMALGRALLRCGDVEGGMILTRHLSEARLCLARAARSELVIATGQDFGFEVRAWQGWLSQYGEVLKPNPDTREFA